MINFSTEATRRNTFDLFSNTFRRIFDPILLNGQKQKSKNSDKTDLSFQANKLIEQCSQNSKVFPTSSERPIEINFNTPDHIQHVCAEIAEQECPICFLPLPKTSKQLECGHISCDDCLIKYLKTEISESRVSITCPECNLLFHPNRIQELLTGDNKRYLLKYEEFSIRKVLVIDPDTRYCPAPDCNYALIAPNCSKCPILKCGRIECGTLFCYNCQKKCTSEHRCKTAIKKTKSSRKEKRKKHSSDKVDSKEIKNKSDLDIDNLTLNTNETCSDENLTNFDTSEFLSRFNMKPCPACRILIIKIEDGSCNHMTCSVCGCQWCWLCIKKTSELHYLSPSGCTFFGKRKWSKKKKLFWQCGMLLGAPLFITLSAAIAVPSIVIGVPVWFGRKLQNKLSTRKLGKFKKCVFVTSGVISSAVISPVLAAGAVAIGVPFLLAYVYGIVPITLCRSKAQTNDQKDQPIKISDEEAQAFLKQLSEKDYRSQITVKERSSKRRSKDKQNKGTSKSNDKYDLFGKSSFEVSMNSTIDNRCTKEKKGSSNKYFDHDLNFVEQNSSSKDGSLSSISSNEIYSDCKSIPENILEDSNIVEVHCDRFGKLNKSKNKKLEVKSLENLTNLNYCETCNTSHLQKIVHRPCCPNFRD